MRIPIGARGLFAAAALAGGIVYWRATAQRRSHRLADAVDDAIAEGRAAAEGVGGPSNPLLDRFDTS